MQPQPLSRLAQEDIIAALSKEWMIVTAGTPSDFNLLTASWGGIGYAWNKPVAFVFVRPERYTHRFIERHEAMTLSFLGNDPKMRQAYQLIGTKSGRDLDKAAAAGLTPIATSDGNVAYRESRLTLEGRKLFQTDLRAEEFHDTALRDQWYSAQKGGFHTLYVVEITALYE